ncbi:nicotianamine synthase 9-like [Zingiber officinale]|uniref:Nicotianamine synthase n=1 Tax=Zingiber officinale TaxID=94328 RepID=A0A8J5FPV8_ZINOF|nr:nicotianamine synthase 9-like [Zingiber officinale]KAG6491864.1 hypothetical protein ZIOFF_046803 [Zingiber officinale]
MGERGQEESVLVLRISEIYGRISELSNLSPSMEVDAIFTELVHTCIPVVAIDVSKLSSEVQAMRTKLIKLCGEAEGLMECHYSDILASFDNPLDHLRLFPYYNNYLKLSQLEYTLLARHAPAPARVAFVGSGPLPLSSIVLAAHHVPAAAQIDNYDVDAAANERARRLVRGGSDLAARLAFHTADVMCVTQALRGYDVVFLAALVGVEREEKVRVVEHLARHMAPGAFLVARSAHGARAFLYPVVDPAEDLKGFEVLTVHHPDDEVINSVIVARKPTHAGGHPPAAAAVMRPCKCCEMVQGLHHFGHGSIVEEVGLEEVELPSS